MALSGNERLLRAGYSEAQLAAADAVAAERGITLYAGESLIDAVKSGHSIAAPVELLRGAGISGRAVSAGERYEFYGAGEPSVKTSLSEREITIQPGEVPAFVSGGAAGVQAARQAQAQQVQAAREPPYQIIGARKTGGEVFETRRYPYSGAKAIQIVKAGEKPAPQFVRAARQPPAPFGVFKAAAPATQPSGIISAGFAPGTPSWQQKLWAKQTLGETSYYRTRQFESEAAELGAEQQEFFAKHPEKELSSSDYAEYQALVAKQNAFSRKYGRELLAADILQGEEFAVTPKLVSRAKIPRQGIDVKKAFSLEEMGFAQYETPSGFTWYRSTEPEEFQKTVMLGTLVGVPMAASGLGAFSAGGWLGLAKFGGELGAFTFAAEYGKEHGKGLLETIAPGKEEWRYELGATALGFATGVLGAKAASVAMNKLPALISKPTVFSRTVLSPTKTGWKFKTIGEKKGLLTKEPFIEKGFSFEGKALTRTELNRITDKKFLLQGYAEPFAEEPIIPMGKSVTVGDIVFGKKSFKSIFGKGGKIKAKQLAKMGDLPVSAFIDIDYSASLPLAGKLPFAKGKYLPELAGIEGETFAGRTIKGVSVSSRLAPTKTLPEAAGWKQFLGKWRIVTIGKTEKGLAFVDIATPAKKVSLIKVKDLGAGVPSVSMNEYYRTTSTALKTITGTVPIKFIKASIIKPFVPPATTGKGIQIVDLTGFGMPESYIGLSRGLKRSAVTVQQQLFKPSVVLKDYLGASAFDKAVMDMRSYAEPVYFKEMQPPKAAETETKLAKEVAGWGSRNLGNYVGRTPAFAMEYAKEREKREMVAGITEKTLEQSLAGAAPKIRIGQKPKVKAGARESELSRALTRAWQPTAAKAGLRVFGAAGITARTASAEREMEKELERTLEMKKTKGKTRFIFPFPMPKFYGRKAFPVKLFAEGFNVFLRKGGKFMQISKQPLSKLSALGLGAMATESAARTFFIQPTKKAGIRISRFEKAWRPERFRQPMGKSRLPKGAFVERAKYAIDYPTEFKEITYKGLVALRKKKGGKKSHGRQWF